MATQADEDVLPQAFRAYPLDFQQLKVVTSRSPTLRGSSSVVTLDMLDPEMSPMLQRERRAQDLSVAGHAQQLKYDAQLQSRAEETRFFRQRDSPALVRHREVALQRAAILQRARPSSAAASSPTLAVKTRRTRPASADHRSRPPELVLGASPQWRGSPQHASSLPVSPIKHASSLPGSPIKSPKFAPPRSPGLSQSFSPPVLSTDPSQELSPDKKTVTLFSASWSSINLVNRLLDMKKNAAAGRSLASGSAAQHVRRDAPEMRRRPRRRQRQVPAEEPIVQETEEQEEIRRMRAMRASRVGLLSHDETVEGSIFTRPVVARAPTPLTASAPPWYVMPAEVIREADSFDSRHWKRAARAERFLDAVGDDLRSTSKLIAFNHAVLEVERNRYIAPNYFKEVKVYKGSAPRKKVVEEYETAAGLVWSLPMSIWAPRAKWCDSKDFVDTEHVKHEKFKIDWQGAVDVQKIETLIVKADDDGAADADGDGTLDEVEDTRSVLWDFHDLYFAIFDYYAGTIGNDVLTMSYNGWTQFVVDCGLASSEQKHMKKADFDRIFIGIDAKQRLGSKGGDIPKKSLLRSGFLAALLHVAIAKYVTSKEILDVSDAFHELLAADIEPALDQRVFCSTNTFRTRYCYSEDVDSVLRRFESSLRLIFAGISGSEGKEMGKEHLAQVLDFGEWRAFLRALNFIGPDLTDRDGCLCFVSSRMAVINGQNEKGVVKEANLTFEGFLEAIVRLAALKALPSDEEVYDAGHPDAGAFLCGLKAMDAAAYNKFISSRGHQWPGQPVAGMEMWRCVEGVITLMFAVIGKAVGDDDRVLTKAEVDAWVTSVLRGGAGTK